MKTQKKKHDQNVRLRYGTTRLFLKMRKCGADISVFDVFVFLPLLTLVQFIFSSGGVWVCTSLSAQSRLDDKTEAAKSAQKQLEQKSLELVDARTKLAASEASGMVCV